MKIVLRIHSPYSPYDPLCVRRLGAWLVGMGGAPGGTGGGSVGVGGGPGGTDGVRRPGMRQSGARGRRPSGDLCTSGSSAGGARRPGTEATSDNTDGARQSGTEATSDGTDGGRPLRHATASGRQPGERAAARRAGGSPASGRQPGERAAARRAGGSP
ncbi:hypothetical protein ACFY8B_25745, partial [Streptomyces sp. NPDC012751]